MQSVSQVRLGRFRYIVLTLRRGRQQIERCVLGTVSNQTNHDNDPFHLLLLFTSASLTFGLTYPVKALVMVSSMMSIPCYSASSCTTAARSARTFAPILTMGRRKVPAGWMGRLERD